MKHSLADADRLKQCELSKQLHEIRFNKYYEFCHLSSNEDGPKEIMTHGDHNTNLEEINDENIMKMKENENNVKIPWAQ